MQETPRIIGRRDNLHVDGKIDHDDPLDDQAIWYLNGIIGVAGPDDELARAVLATMGEDGPATLAAALFETSGRSFPHDDAGGLCSAIVDYLIAPPAAQAPPEITDAPLQADDQARSAGVASGVDAMYKARHERQRAKAVVNRALRKAFWDTHAGRELRTPLAVAEARVARIFNLSEAEIGALSYIYTSSQRSELSAYLDNLPLQAYHACMAAAIGVPQTELKRMLGQTGRLVAMGFVRPDFLPPPHFALGSDIVSLYHDPESSPYYARPLEDFVRESDCQLFPLETYPVAPISRELVSAFLAGSGGHVLVHGEPGTGKTSFVVSAIMACGRPAFVLRLVDHPEERYPDYIKLKMAAYLCAGTGAILVVDESDSLINTASQKPGDAQVTKAWLTEFMDASGTPVVWIANDIEGVHEAVRRRFIYSLRFKGQTDAQRGQLWRRLASLSEAGRILRDEDIERLAKDYRVNASGISLALRGLEQAGRSGALRGEPELRHLSELLSRYQELVHGDEPTASVGRSAPARFVPEAISTDLPLKRVLSGLRGAAARVRSRLELESVGATVPTDILEGAEAKLLFYGPPGTGKTAYARYLAGELGLPLVQKRASDLLSMFVGQTEKSIAAVFAEAEDQGALLFLDEVDSLLLDRRSARESWARSQVNELLSRMEDYRGVLVCCTNYIEGLDPAVLRRFQWKVAFMPPEPAARLVLYRRYFEELAGSLDAEDERRVLALDGLCPGDLAAVHKAVASLHAGDEGEDGETGKMTHAELVRMLAGELRVRESGRPRALGFAS